MAGGKGRGRKRAAVLEEVVKEEISAPETVALNGKKTSSRSKKVVETPTPEPVEEVDDVPVPLKKGRASKAAKPKAEDKPTKEKKPTKKTTKKIKDEITEEEDTQENGLEVENAEVSRKRTNSKQNNEEVEEEKPKVKAKRGKKEKPDLAVEEKEKVEEVKTKSKKSRKAEVIPTTAAELPEVVSNTKSRRVRKTEPITEPIDAETEVPPKSKRTRKPTVEAPKLMEDDEKVVEKKSRKQTTKASKEPVVEPIEKAEIKEKTVKNKPTKVDKKEKTVEKKPVRERGKRKVEETVEENAEVDENDQTIDEPSTSKKTKTTTKDTQYDQINFAIEKEHKVKISSWNVAGLRSWLTKGGLKYIEHEKPDVLCLQETKATDDQLPDEARIPGYHPYWLCKKGGYAGVAIYSKIMPINVEYGLNDEEQDTDGRILTAEYEKYYLICVYVPNSGRKLVTLDKRLRWNKLFDEYVKQLDKKKPVIICGDMNVSHKEIDLANPKSNKRNAGFTQEERDGFSDLLSQGFVDTFRHFNPDREKAYTYWTYMANARAKNVGWRLDYFIVSERIINKVVDIIIRDKVMGSDHCPITLFTNF